MEQTKSRKKQKEDSGSLGNIFKHPLEFRQPEEILKREVKKFGDGSAHVLVPKKHIGSEAQITIWKDKEDYEIEHSIGRHGENIFKIKEKEEGKKKQSK